MKRRRSSRSVWSELRKTPPLQERDAVVVDVPLMPAMPMLAGLLFDGGGKPTIEPQGVQADAPSQTVPVERKDDRDPDR